MSTASVSLDRSIPLGAVSTVFTITLRSLIQWRRALLLIVLAMAPLVVVFIFRGISVPRFKSGELLPAFLEEEFITVMLYCSSVVAPITTLLLASGMIRDEQENQTLTYLLLCPIPRWVIYLSKISAAILVAWLITSIFTGITLAALWTGSGLENEHRWVTRWLALLAPTALLIAANAGLFGLISVLLRPSLIIGVVYIAVFEIFLANYPFVLRKFTSVHYYQCLVCNWIGEQFQLPNTTNKSAIKWSVAQEVLPDSQECIITLLSIFLVSTLAAMYVFTTREFRMKTPEGN